MVQRSFVFEAAAERGYSASGGRGLADLYATVVEGTLIMRHVHGRNEAAKLAKPMVERLVADHLPSA